MWAVWTKRHKTKQDDQIVKRGGEKKNDAWFEDLWVVE